MPNLQFQVKMPTLAFLEIEVKDGYFGDLGIFCSPLTMIKEHGKNFVKTGYSLKQWLILLSNYPRHNMRFETLNTDSEKNVQKLFKNCSKILGSNQL